MDLNSKMNDWSESPNVTEETYNAVQWGKKLERERIIALLETDATTGTGTEYCTLPLDEEHCHWCFEIVRLIALIKGDNK